MHSENREKNAEANVSKSSAALSRTAVAATSAFTQACVSRSFAPP